VGKTENKTLLSFCISPTAHNRILNNVAFWLHYLYRIVALALNIYIYYAFIFTFIFNIKRNIYIYKY
jgi:hypothetical protein